MYLDKYMVGMTNDILSDVSNVHEMVPTPTNFSFWQNTFDADALCLGDILIMSDSN